MSFEPLGNMGCRTWWGRGDLKPIDLGVWRGGWLFGVNGPPEGRFDRAFAAHCADKGYLCVRTVELFWAFEYHRNGFPMQFREAALKRRWKEENDHRERTLSGEIPVMLNGRSLRGERLRQYVEEWFPLPAWRSYLARQKKYFMTELARYRSVVNFWRNCGLAMRRAFLRCARYSNRRPESHPDYFVLFRAAGCSPIGGFVEVKGPRESIRTSQKAFFPELVCQAGQRIWLARFNQQLDVARFLQLDGDGTWKLDERLRPW